MFTYIASLRPSLKSLMVSVDIKHRVYLLTGEMGNNVRQFSRFIDHGGGQRHQAEVSNRYKSDMWMRNTD